MLGILIASVSLVAASAAIQNSIPSVSGVYLDLPAEAGAVSTDSTGSVHFVQYPGSSFIPLDAIVEPIPTSPLQQVKDRIPTDEVTCKDRRVLMLSPSGAPVCVFAKSVGALEQRGFETVIHPEPRPIPREVAAANNAFAVNFYKEIAVNDGNIFFSPVGMYTAFSMLYGEANGETADEIRDTFGLIEDDDARHQAMLNMTSALSRDQHSVLEVANSLWFAEVHVPQEPRVDAARDVYGVEIGSVDFADKDGAAGHINEWSDENTRGKIPHVLNPEEIGDNMDAAMFNTAYFKGEWDSRFNPEHTYEADFWNGVKNVTASFMHSVCGSKYATFDDVQVINRIYRGDNLSMLVVLPSENDGIESLEKSLSAEMLQKWQEVMRYASVKVALPKFNMRADYDLTPYLNNLGVKSIFTGGNLAGISEGVLVDKAVQSAYVEVDEEGTPYFYELCTVLGIGPEPPRFTADHPFLFFIQDNESGAIFFMGRVMDPTA